MSRALRVSRYRWKPGVTRAYAPCDISDTATCTHLDQIEHLAPEGAIAGCPQCMASGDSWVHLRMCQVCGQIGCCDNSPNRHATRHHEETGHVIIRSVEPGEDWSWCYEDEVFFRLPGR